MIDWRRELVKTIFLSDEMVDEEEIQEEIAQDGFFMGNASDGGSGGIPGLDDGDENNKEKERNERDLRNRSTSVSLEDLQNEFQETIMNEENCFSNKVGFPMNALSLSRTSRGHLRVFESPLKCFLDELIDNVRNESHEIIGDYKINLEKIFVNKFRTVLASYDKSFQKFKLSDFQAKLCSNFPIDDVTHSKSNKDFMSPEHMCEYVQKTIEQHQNLYLQFDWKTPVLDSEITLNYDPRKKKAVAIAQVGFQKFSKLRYTLTDSQNLEFYEAFFDENLFENPTEYNSSKDQSNRSTILQDVEMYEHPTKKRESPRPKDKAAANIHKPKPWDEIAKSVSLQIEKVFSTVEEDTLGTGYDTDGDSLFRRILEPVKILHEVTNEEIESVYWRILLGLGSQSQYLRNNGKLMPFALNEDASGSQTPTTGIQFIQHTDRKECLLTCFNYPFVKRI